MKKVLLTLMAFGAMTASALTASAEEKPAITFKTNIYDSYGAENRFQFVIGATETDFYDVDCGFGMVETEVVEAEFAKKENGVRMTQATGLEDGRRQEIEEQIYQALEEAESDSLYFTAKKFLIRINNSGE